MSESIDHEPAQPISSYPVVILLFGTLRILINGQPSNAFRLNKTRALLAYLLVEKRQRFLRAELAALLWPGYTAESARVNLRQTLADLRKLFAPLSLLTTTKDHVILQADPAVVWCDVQAFQALLNNWQQHDHRALADCPLCRKWLQQAIALAQDNFLDMLPDMDSPPFEAWRQAQRNRMTEQLTAARAALGPISVMSGNLRPMLTSLIGRATELAELATKVRHPIYRCLTLTGPGGVGKTRLVRALGAELQTAFPDGVWLIELAALSPAAPLSASVNMSAAAMTTQAWLHDRIATAIADTLEIKFHTNARASQQVITHLHNKTALLILDNFEHLEAGADWLPILLEAAPNIRLVITSRHRLPLQAQLVYEVQGLPVPPLHHGAMLPAAAFFTDYASIQLFIERATNAQLNLPHDSQTLTIISQICRFVAGSPLAIELAVAMLDHQSPASLLQALRANYRLLAATWRDLPPRQRSAEAVLHSAWALLTPTEATLLATCAVFHGGFTQAAVQAIAEMRADDLQQLLHKSLVHPAGGEHFILHELVRQFAAEQLAQMPVVQRRVYQQHATYYIDFAQAQERALLHHFVAQQVLQHELENLRMAWQWSTEHGELDLLSKGASSLFTFYRLTGLYHEAIQQVESALNSVRQLHTATPTDPTPLRLLIRFLSCAADFYRRIGEIAISTTMAEEALALGQQLADPALQGSALHELARLAQVRGDFQTMQRLAEEGCQQARLGNASAILAECLNAVGWALYSQEKPLAAISYFQTALAALADAPNAHLEGRIRANLGRSYLSTRNYMVARGHLEQALIVQQRLYDREEILLTHFMLGELWTAIGDYTAAQQEFALAHQLIQLTANPYWVCWLQVSYGHWQQRRGDYSSAQITLNLAYQTAQHSANKVFECATLIHLGNLFIDQENWIAAQGCYEQSLTLQTGSSGFANTADVQAGLALCALALDKPTAALAYVDTALALLADHGPAAAGQLFQVYWFCLRVLQATDAPYAADLLRTAYALLQADAAQFTDTEQRSLFLEQVAAHRAILASAQAAGLSQGT